MARLFNAESGRMVLVTADYGICINPINEIET
jgi:DhnA family fructose-bisphosphate aldolase class Ia